MTDQKLTFDPPVIAHRGASALAPENTLAALVLAREQKSPWVEFDVKITSDGVPILMHDENLKRTTSGTGDIANENWSDIRKLDAGSWFQSNFTGERVPHLEEALKLVLETKMRANIEIKPCPGRAKATTMVALIEVTKWWPAERLPPLISSFSEEALASSMQLQPQWPRSFAFHKWETDWEAAANRIEAEAFTVNEQILTRENLSTLKRRGLPILAYTVDDPMRARDLLEGGVAAIFSNNPKEMMEALSKGWKA